MLKCSICSESFHDEEVLAYAAHVSECATKRNEELNHVRLRKINSELEELKRVKVYYEGLRDKFKAEYPDVYESNFMEEECDDFLEQMPLDGDDLDGLAMLSPDELARLIAYLAEQDLEPFEYRG